MNEQDVCGAQHPSMEDVRCAREPGLNAQSQGDITFDDAGNQLPPVEGPMVHVHAGSSEDGGTHRWEDVSE